MSEQTIEHDRLLDRQRMPVDRAEGGSRPASKGAWTWGECQPERPSLGEQGRRVLQHAVRDCRLRGQDRRWAVGRLADEWGVPRAEIERWLEGGVPESRVDGVGEVAERVVEEADLRHGYSGEGLSRKRRGLELSVPELARKLGVRPRRLRAWESGESAPQRRSLENIERTLRALGSAWPPERIRALRRAHGWTQADLADAVGVPRSAVSCWERAVRLPAQSVRTRLKTLEREVNL